MRLLTHIHLGMDIQIVVHHNYIGAIPEQKDTHPSQGVLQGAVNKHCLKVKNETDRKMIIKSYYKFMMYRNPVERLVSGYRDKVEKVPLLGLDRSKPERNWINMDTFYYKHPKSYQAWKDKGANTKVNISFSDFIDYWIHTGGLKFDDHFMSTINLCNPCLMRYDYYGEFNSFKEGATVLMNRIGANSSLLMDYHWSVDSGKMSHLVMKYYIKLSSEQKTRIVDILAQDLCFYYTIFPKEKDKHKLIMDIDYDIPCTTS